MARSPRTSPITYLALVAGTALVALAGYGGFVLYPRLDVPSVTGAGLLLLAAGAGIASFFSPCSFGLLVSILARPTAAGAQEVRARPRLGQAFAFASALSLGAATFLLLLGLLIALGGSSLFGDITFTSAAGRIVRVVVGSLLILLGLIQLRLLELPLRRFQPGIHEFLRAQAVLRRRRPLLGFTLFGFGYLLAGFG